MKASEQAEEMLLRVQGIEQQNEDLKTELATLRAQLAGKWVLGEPLEEVKEGQQYIAVATKQNSVHPEGYLEAGCAYEDIDTARTSSWVYYLDPRPLPTLPQSEVPAVPLKQKLDSMFKQVLDEVFPEEPSDE